MGVRCVYMNTVIFSCMKIYVYGIVTFFWNMLLLSSILVLLVEFLIIYGYGVWYSVSCARLFVASIWPVYSLVLFPDTT